MGKLHVLVERSILVEVEHVKAHHTKKEKNNMSQFQKFVTEGNEKADDSTRAKAMLKKQRSKSRSKDNERSRKVRRCCSMRPASTAW